VVWTRDEPGQRFEIFARNAAEVKELLRAIHGDECAITLYNEDDGQRPRDQ
jgi:hypothetical protein